MKKEKHFWYRWGAIAVVFVILFISAIGGISLVWMRQHIAHTAQRVKFLERDMAEITRKNNYLDARIAQAHNPDFLRQRIGETLLPPRETQIVWVSPQHVPARPGDALKDARPFAVSFDLAFMDSVPQTYRR